MLTKAILSLALASGLLSAALLPWEHGAQEDSSAIDIAKLRSMVDNLGYATKSLGDDGAKFEFTVKKGTLDVPIAGEVSASKRFVWLTCFLGKVSEVKGFDSKTGKFLERVFKVQPSHFYVTDKGNLMLGLAIDNRGITPAILRHRIDKIAADTDSSLDLWGS